MKHILLFLLLCSSIISDAQNWNLLQADKIYTFEYCRPINFRLLNSYSQPDTFDNCWHHLYTIGIDTAIGQDTTFLLNTEVDTIETGGGYFHWENVPHLLFNEKLLKQANGDFYFQGKDTVLVRTTAALNDSWIFRLGDTTLATLITIDTISLFGQLDSVKIAVLSNGDSLAWTKNRGLILFPGVNNEQARLAAIQKDSIYEGLRIPDFWDFYDFEVGDVFMYQGYAFSCFFFPGCNCTTKTKVTITSKQRLSDRYVYNYNIVQNGNGCAFTCPLNFRPIDRLNFIKDSSVVNQLGNSLVELYDLAGQGYSPYLIFSGTDVESEKYAFLSDYEYYKYNKGLGATFADNNSIGTHVTCSLIGFVKGTDTVGIVYSDSIILGVEQTEAPIAKNFRLYPNPTQTITILEIFIDDATFLRIYNTQSELVYSQKLELGAKKQQLNLSELPVGMYFVQIFDEDGNLKGVEKLLLLR